MSELYVLTQLLRQPTTGTTPQLAQLLHERDVNWHALLELSIAHSVAPLVDLALSQSSTDIESLVPSDVRASFSQQYLIHLSVNLRRWQHFSEMLAAFQQEHIACLPLKGLILGPWLYGDAGRRTMTDLDVLVRSEQVPLALSILEALGYQRIDSPHEEPTYEIPMAHTTPDGTRTFLDLHWTFVPPHPNTIDPTFAWERANHHDVDGLRVLLLSPEDLLLTLCLHLRRNLQHLSLKLLVDLHWLLSKYGDQWDLEYLAKQARQLRMRNTTSYALILMSHSMQLPVPRALLNAFRAPKTLQRMWTHWAGFELATHARRQSDRQRALWWRIQLSKFTLMDSWSDVIRIAGQNVRSRHRQRTHFAPQHAVDKDRVAEQVTSP